ncbi:hypothetical protein BU23DRAFT_442266, partial [Bimuria novae-zelandiae CBS 107.79]
WIDQLCIDQKNTEEHSHQVGVMHEIFHRARDMVIWLGPDGDGSRIAMDFIRTVDLADDNKHAEKAWATQAQVSVQVEALRALKALFQRRYWNRLWVIQEIMYARRIAV